MKKSNKLLLGIFLTGVLIFTGLHVALYAKYKSGNYTTYTSEMMDSKMNVYPLANHTAIRLENIETVLLYASSTPSLKYDKEQRDIKVTDQNGVIVISAPKRANGEGSRDVAVRVYADSSVLVALKNGRGILMNGGDSSLKLNIALDQSQLVTSDDTNQNGYALGQLDVKAVNHSDVRLEESRINKLSVDLQKSSFSENKSSFREMQFRSDDSSRVSLSAHLLKITKTNINE